MTESPDLQDFIDQLLTRVGRPPWLADRVIERLELDELFARIYSAGVEDGRDQMQQEDAFARDLAGESRPSTHTRGPRPEKLTQVVLNGFRGPWKDSGASLPQIMRHLEIRPDAARKAVEELIEIGLLARDGDRFRLAFTQVDALPDRNAANRAANRARYRR